jgi:hypothetical protein
LLNPAVIRLLKETSNKVAKEEEPRQKRVYRKRGLRPRYTELEKNIVKANFKSSSKRIAKMLGGRHTWKGINALKHRIKKGLV